jgi:hypothetical protein
MIVYFHSTNAQGTPSFKLLAPLGAIDMPIDTTDIGPSEYISPVQNIYVSILASFAGGLHLSILSVLAVHQNPSRETHPNARMSLLICSNCKASSSKFEDLDETTAMYTIFLNFIHWKNKAFAEIIVALLCG